MTVGTKFHRESPVEAVMVSYGSRRDALPATCNDETYADQLNKVTQRLIAVQGEMLTCNKAALEKEQARIRRNGSNAQTMAEYRRVKIKLNDKRMALVAEQKALEAEAVRLRPLARSENIRDSNTEELSNQQVRKIRHQSLEESATRITSLLVEIRDQLKMLLEKSQ